MQVRHVAGWAVVAIVVGTACGCAEQFGEASQPTIDQSVTHDKPALDEVPTEVEETAGEIKSADAERNPQSKRRILVYIKSRDYLLAVHTWSGEGDTGPRFTVTTTDGRELMSEVSSDELRMHYPELYESYRTSYAEAWAAR
jgi:hypothetical protein